MKPLYLILEDGAVFEGQSVNEALETAGLLSFYTGVVGYQEVITDPANLGKIIVFTYPLIGNYGVNSEDAESAATKVAGAIAKEYPPYYSNFRAEGNLADYLSAGGASFGQGFDTRAILLHLREHGEMKAVLSPERLDPAAAAARISQIQYSDYETENDPVHCPDQRLKAAVLDLGASRSFFRYLASAELSNATPPNDADIIVVSDAPYYLVGDDALTSQVKAWIGRKPVVGFGHGAAVVARACGAHIQWLPFGDHGVNIPVRFHGGGRNEITVQNHHYTVTPGNGVDSLFENVHDGTCEGFVAPACHAAGVNFLPTPGWFEAILNSVGVRFDA